MDYKLHLENLLDCSIFMLSDIKPSEWTEKNRVMTSNVTAFPGPYSYKKTPYLREIIDCLSKNHPSKWIAIMKGAQIGFSVGVIESGIGYIIAQAPGNILFLTGHSDLSEESINKIDVMIDNTGLRPLIRPNVMRARNMRTGDTNKSKEFPGGSLVSGSAGNHKLLMQRSVQYGFIDDFDAAKESSKEDGSTRTLIEQRFASFADKMKLFYISTPRLKSKSNIEATFKLGDQRKYHVPCPHCGELIVWEWSVPIEDTTEKGGIYYKLDVNDQLIPGSVGYICQKCSGFFKDTNKSELLLMGKWIPTAVPSKPGYYSYHLSSLYAPAGMYDWEHYVGQYLEACPPKGPRSEALYKTFVNLCLGETYEEIGESPKANELQKNIRGYEIGIIPEKLSERDGNGKIVLLTLACDLNGFMDDARLDYEVVAWSESGANYSIQHGSIGTFIPRENTIAPEKRIDRERWTYQHGKSNSVWKELKKIMAKSYDTDTGKRLKIFHSAVDTGHFTIQAYQFIDNVGLPCVGLKGTDKEKNTRIDIDAANFKPSKERSKLYLVEVNQMKDELAAIIKLRHDINDDQQPLGFMNFPQPSNGLYGFTNYFKHYEAEHKIVENKEGQPVTTRWVKKDTVVQNHFFDVRLYNMVVKDIFVSTICKEFKIKNYTWKDYVEIVTGKRKK